MESKSFEGYVNGFIAHRLVSATNVALSAFQNVPDLSRIEPHVRANSATWAEKFFQDRANPHRAANIKVASHAAVGDETYDLIFYEYEAGRFSVRLYESRTFALLFITAPKADQLLQRSTQERMNDVRHVSAALLNLESDWRPRAPCAPEESLAFSTDPAVNVNAMSSWAQRVDAGVFRGELYFLCYKKLPHTVGFESGQGWLARGSK